MMLERSIATLFLALCLAASAQAQSYTYDAVGRLKTATWPNGTTRVYTYDDRGFVVRTEFPDGNEKRYAYDAFGNFTEITDPLGLVTRLGGGESVRASQLDPPPAGILDVLGLHAARLDAEQEALEALVADLIGFVRRSEVAHEGVADGRTHDADHCAPVERSEASRSCLCV